MKSTSHCPGCGGTYGSPPKGKHTLGCGYQGEFEDEKHDQNRNQGRKNPIDWDRQKEVMRRALEDGGFSTEDAESKAEAVLQALSDILFEEQG